jgi:hypothetical protein
MREPYYKIAKLTHSLIIHFEGTTQTETNTHTHTHRLFEPAAGIPDLYVNMRFFGEAGNLNVKGVYKLHLSPCPINIL